MKTKSLAELKNIFGKKVLLRLDCNVPLRGKKIVDDFKILQSLPTLKFLISAGAKVIVVSHLGRPKSVDSKLSLRPIKNHLEKLLRRQISFFPLKNIEQPEFFDKIKPGAVAMLENIRFLPGEENNDPRIAKQLASIADVFVLDGFAVAHRDSASVSGVAKYLPSYAGLLLAKEVSALSGVMSSPKRPLVLILGGAKSETKIPVLQHFLSKADFILLGGTIAAEYIASKSKGMPFAPSLFKTILKKISGSRHATVILPVDVVVGDAAGKNTELMAVEQYLQQPKSRRAKAIFDVGPATTQLYSAYIKKAATIVWNGAMGKFEVPDYSHATLAIAHLVAARSSSRAYGIVGGGETVEIIRSLGLLEDIDLVSTGGGAMLEFLSGKNLPGVMAVQSVPLRHIRR